ncbi:EspA/EspE family type VII secretion system effector [Mycolicibacterium sp. F2034L]|uniref:EspA/EspE family type VII secretion system effector n=1 Tax=Mycolicibacterium sp. F2034L TaxID=2926422 RepID=UPI001FF5F944|nr:EspA/EspE family type VII secretion system effector [Mycolicibacterium sp. F2034L]MCK0175552.1 hypothetical protein [Mycolicibacterium sp. F2034L]
MTDILGDAADLIPPNPITEAIDSVGNLIDVARAIDDNGIDALWNAAADIGEGASVVEFFLPKSKQTPIISGGLKIIQGFQHSCGDPNEIDRGDGYAKGYQKHNEIADALAKPVPNPTWTGAASDAYSYANEQQRLRAKRMVDADIAINGAISAEAHELTSVRRMLNEAATVMGNAIIPAVAALAIPRYGKGLSLAIQLGVVGAAVPGAIWRMEALQDVSENVSKSVTDAKRIYEEVTRSCVDINL